MPAKPTVRSMTTKNRLLWAVVVTLLVAGSVGVAGLFLGWWAIGPEVISDSGMSMDITDYATGDALDANVYVYESKLDLTELANAGTEFDELDFADFKLSESGDEDITIEPESDHYYMVKVNSTGYLTEWFQPISGVNFVYLMNITESVNAIALNSTLGNTLGGDAWNNTDTEWNVMIQCDEDYGDEDFDVSEIKGNWEGYKTVYNFPGDYYNRTIISITFNAAPSLNDCKILNYENNKVISGNSLLLGVDAVLIGRTSIELKFDADAFTGNFITSIDVQHGDISGTPVQLANAAT
jgi:hypothetical protein